MTKEEAVIQGLQGYIEALNETIKKQDKVIKALEQQGNTWSLDDAREDFMHDVYNTLDFLPTNNEANRIIDSFDRVTSDIKQQPSDDCVSRSDVLTLIDDTNLKHLFSSTRGISQKAFEDLLSGTKALLPVTPTHGTCKDCKRNGTMRCKCLLSDGSLYMSYKNPDFYCANFERRGSENENIN